MLIGMIEGAPYKAKYAPRRVLHIQVDGKVVGNIRASGDGYAYFPKGSRRGYAPEVFKTMREVQRSLEGDQQGRDR